MPDIQTLQSMDMDSLKRLIRGYVSHEKYQVLREENDEKINFSMKLIQLETPYRKVFDVEEGDYYQSILPAGFSFAAYENGEMVALALAEVREWNQSLWIHEFHVLETYHGKGIGRQLMEALAEKAQNAKLRIMVCETQNTNVPAIRFYRKMGFVMDAIDLSLYSNADYPDGEIALFMKRRLG